MKTFKVNSHVVFPGHGVGKITDIGPKLIAGVERKFYHIEILDSGMKIIVPVNSAKEKGLRPIVGKTVAQSILKSLNESETELDTTSNWNVRYRQYMEAISTGNVWSLVDVLKALEYRKAIGDLSFGERKMLDTARTQLRTELKLALGIDTELFEGFMRLA